MVWRAVLGTDPEFVELAKPYFEEYIELIKRWEAMDEDERIADELVGFRLFLFGFRSYEKLHDKILFYNYATGQRYLKIYGGLIVVRLSRIGPADEENATRLLERALDFSRPPPASSWWEPDSGQSILTYKMSVTTGHPALSDLKEAIFTLDYETRLGSGSCAYAVYLDLPLDQCYQWAREFEETVKKIVPGVRFYNHIGLCNQCGAMLRLEEHEVDWFLCAQCRAANSQRARAEEERKRMEREERKRQRKLGMIKMRPSPGETLHRNNALHRALHKIYRGKCQYCPMPAAQPLKATVIEHIIPRSIPLESVSFHLQQMGLSTAHADHFCALLLPPRHDCVLNYTLACTHHNNQKAGQLLHLVALDLLLRCAKRRAVKILNLYTQLLSR